MQDFGDEAGLQRNKRVKPPLLLEPVSFLKKWHGNCTKDCVGVSIRVTESAMSLETDVNIVGGGQCQPVVPTADWVLKTVRHRLSVSVYVSLRSVRCQLQDGTLTLSGILPSYYIKQVLLSLVEDLREGNNCRVLDKTTVVSPSAKKITPEWM